MPLAGFDNQMMHSKGISISVVPINQANLREMVGRSFNLLGMILNSFFNVHWLPLLHVDLIGVPHGVENPTTGFLYNLCCGWYQLNVGIKDDMGVEPNAESDDEHGLDVDL